MVSSSCRVTTCFEYKLRCHICQTVVIQSSCHAQRLCCPPLSSSSVSSTVTRLLGFQSWQKLDTADIIRLTSATRADVCRTKCSIVSMMHCSSTCVHVDFRKYTFTSWCEPRRRQRVFTRTQFLAQ